MLERLVHCCGTKVRYRESGLTHLFPTPAQVAKADLSSLGLMGSRVKTLRMLAEAVVEGRIDWEAAPEQVCSVLKSIPGIGDWTVQYVALRGLGEPDAFPASDLVLRRRAGVGGKPLSRSAMEQRSNQWVPWRGYAAIYLWRGEEGDVP
jgi:AraC family transcriptional regulator of adaptative response / DNA-3-methyladenine glycosylase II